MRVAFIFVAALFVAGCGSSRSASNSTSIPNPASVKCIKDGHKLEIRKDAGGNEYGVCIAASGSECDEWKYFRGECKLD